MTYVTEYEDHKAMQGEIDRLRAELADANKLLDIVVEALEAAKKADPYGGDHDLWMPLVKYALERIRGHSPGIGAQR